MAAGTLKASDILTPVRRVLRDTDVDKRWDDATLLGYLRDAETEIISLFPGANLVYEALALTPGEIRHDILPASAIQLVAVPRNMGSSGTSPGQMVTEMSMDQLALVQRGWATSGAKEIDQVGVKLTDPRRFWTSPRAHPSVAMYLEVAYSDMPALLATTAKLVSVPNHYKRVLQLFVQGWALTEDDGAASVPRGQAFIQQAYQALEARVSQGKAQAAQEEADG